MKKSGPQSVKNYNCASIVTRQCGRYQDLVLAAKVLESLYICTGWPEPLSQYLMCYLNWLFVDHLCEQRRLWRVCTRIHGTSVQPSVRCINVLKILPAFMLNGLIVCLPTRATTWKKALLYISNLLSKFTQLFNAVICMAFFKVIASTVTCKCSILTTRQRI